MYLTDEVVTPLSPRLLNAAVASELVALALLVAACGWMPWNYHGHLLLARLFLLAHLLRAFGESVLLGALAHALYRRQGYHERVLECTAVVMVVYHLLAATGYAVGVSATLVSVSEAVAVASVLLSCVAGGGMAIYGYRRQRTVGLLLAAATLTAYPLWEEPGIAVLWWTANKVLTAWLYLLVRRLLKRPTPALPEREGGFLADS